MNRRPTFAALSVALIFAGATACSDETTSAPQAATTGATSTSPASSETPTTTASTMSGDPTKYCGLVAALDARGNKVFRPLGRDATPAQYRQAERRFLRENGALVAQVVPALPERLRDEGQALLTAMRQRAGLQVAEPVSNPAASKAEKIILAFERRVCTD